MTTSTYQLIDIGTAPNDGTGDTVREAFRKINSNFGDIYAGGIGGGTGDGYTGSQGSTGETGYSGSLGYTGSSSGYTGSQGVTGVTGSVGYTGSQGSQGYNGSLGYTGSRGIQGYDGSKGAAGSYELSYSMPGTLYAGAGTMRWYMDSTRTISNVIASVSTSPTGNSVIFDVNKNGTTIFTTQANRPTITSGTYVTLTNTPDVVNLSSGDYITVDVDSVGTTVAGEDAVVRIVLA